jgi:hypothetical protein
MIWYEGTITALPMPPRGERLPDEEVLPVRWGCGHRHREPEHAAECLVKELRRTFAPPPDRQRSALITRKWWSIVADVTPHLGTTGASGEQ